MPSVLKLRFLWLNSPSGSRTPLWDSSVTLRHTTLGRTPLCVSSDNHRDFYLTTHNTPRDRHLWCPPPTTVPSGIRNQSWVMIFLVQIISAGFFASIRRRNTQYYNPVVLGTVRCRGHIDVYCKSQEWSQLTTNKIYLHSSSIDRRPERLTVSQ